MSDFLDVASDLLRSNAVPEKRTEFEKVFAAIGALQSVHSKAQLDLNNIESIFTVLELGRIIQRVPGLSFDEIPKAIVALKELIVKTLEVTMTFPTEGPYICVPPPYEDFGNLLTYLYKEAFPNQTAAVISFNYDVAADMAIYRAGLGPDYIIEKSSGHHITVPLLKLHGSLNWATETISRKIRPLHLASYFQHYTFRGIGEKRSATHVPIGSQLVEYFQSHASTAVDAEPVIVPPSWNKADYHTALSDVWAAAAKHLSEAEHIFIIGYSLPETDSFFRHLYALGSVGTVPLRRIAIFNPDDSGVIDSRFQTLLGPGASARYEYHTKTFAQAIAHIKTLFPKRI
ncbi:MAG: hypothetical protein DID91_2727704778 [Candidatus Nitrotoga sp. MKT]|nr:MAG: hypothetical protein DID91_2727704778 [Candidatus Nitrotoga sp. MKT]